MKRFLPLIALCVLQACSGGTEARAVPLPDRWRLPTASEVEGENSRLRDQDGRRFLQAQGDFDGDGSLDEARLLVDTAAEKYGLLVKMSGRGWVVLTDGPAARLRQIGVSSTPPGGYLTACGKGYDVGVDCGDDEIRLANAGLELFVFESSSSLFHWTGDRFSSVPTSD